ncbi:MAG: CBS domain-containing protein [Acidobacteria bacterium]|nr:CBS domain-containing protein [Acidobacteriota bacterium]
MSTVAELMTRKVVMTDPEATVLEAVRRMTEHSIGALLVVKDQVLKGILSERDVARRVVAEGRDPKATQVGEVATPHPVTVKEFESLRRCTELIREHGFRHLPVVDGEGHPVGILSARDLHRFVLAGLEAWIERARTARRIEELTDPYEPLG